MSDVGDHLIDGYEPPEKRPESVVYGECARHPGQSYLDCPGCYLENVRIGTNAFRLDQDDRELKQSAPEEPATDPVSLLDHLDRAEELGKRIAALASAPPAFRREDVVAFLDRWAMGAMGVPRRASRAGRHAGVRLGEGEGERATGVLALMDKQRRRMRPIPTPSEVAAARMAVLRGTDLHEARVCAAVDLFLAKVAGGEYTGPSEGRRRAVRVHVPDLCRDEVLDDAAQRLREAGWAVEHKCMYYGGPFKAIEWDTEG